jgi:DNA (cytosine-5)-methyltransferase 1
MARSTACSRAVRHDGALGQLRQRGDEVRGGGVKIGTFCSGIGAPELVGIAEPIWFAEIDPFASAVLAQRFPGVPNLGDMTAPDLIERLVAAGLPDVVVAGLPCQPFSVAGLRLGTEDPRNLTVRFVEIADAVDDLRRTAGQPPVWWVVENVPGLFSDKGNAFGALMGGLVGDDAALDRPRGGWTNAGVAAGPRRCAAWRVLASQHFGLAQRRARVYLVARGGAGSWAAADALLPVVEGLRWHPAPRRGQGERASRPVASSPRGGSGYRLDADTADDLIPEVAGTLGSDGKAAGSATLQHAEQDLLLAFHARQDPDSGPVTHPLDTDGFSIGVADAWRVRRITPREAERLQGYPDGWTLIPWRGKPAGECPDGPRYRAIGNGMSAPVVGYVLERVAAVRADLDRTDAAA